jgi:squalene-hopene/tetraprenyl-beta-curcumene cyclase
MSLVFPTQQPFRRRSVVGELLEERQTLRDAARAASETSARALVDKQFTDGYWCGELLADISLEADYVLLELWLHPPEHGRWNPPTKSRLEKVCRRILSQQMADGGWWIYPDGPADVNSTVKAYTALRLCGFSPDDEPLRRARFLASRSDKGHGERRKRRKRVRTSDSPPAE